MKIDFRLLLFKSIMIPIWAIGIFFFILAIVFLFLCATIAEAENFVMSIFQLGKYKGRYYRAYRALWKGGWDEVD